MRNVFISYRREDSFAYAGRIYDHLANHFGKQNVFMDVDNIDLGLDFVDVLEQTVSSCSAMVVVIGKQWLTTIDEDGHRRLDNPEDLVRVEVATALDRKIRVLPVLVSGARMPRSQDLPENLAPLSRRNALDIFDTSFHESVERLIEALERILPASGTAECPPPPRADQPRPPVPSESTRPQEMRPDFRPPANDAVPPRRDPAFNTSWPPPPPGPVPAYQPGARAFVATPSAAVPRTSPSWVARQFLFYKPVSPAGWVFHILYYWFVLGTLGALMQNTDATLVGVMCVLSACLWRGARWVDHRDIKKSAARVS